MKNNVQTYLYVFEQLGDNSRSSNIFTLYRPPNT